jgi:hypothetical protein
MAHDGICRQCTDNKNDDESEGPPPLLDQERVREYNTDSDDESDGPPPLISRKGYDTDDDDTDDGTDDGQEVTTIEIIVTAYDEQEQEFLQRGSNWRVDDLISMALK